MNEKQKKKLAKLLTRWGVGEEELKKFLADYDNEPDEEDPEGNGNENDGNNENDGANANENGNANENENANADNNDGNENQNDPSGNEADGNDVENPPVDGKDDNPDGGVVDASDGKENPENENNQTEENNELLTRVGELQDALNGLENRLASLEAGLSKAGVLVNDNPNGGVPADNNNYDGNQPQSSRAEFLAILNGRK